MTFGLPLCTDNYNINQFSSNKHNILNSDLNLSIAVVNCRSIMANRASFTVFIENHHPNIVIGTESWLSPAVLNSEVFPPKYQVFRKDRIDGYGGVFLALECCFICSEIPLNTSCEIVACKIEVCGASLIICAVYRPPNNDDVYLNEVCRVLYEIILNNPKLPIWIAGDFNLPNIDWENLSVNGYNYSLQLCNIILDFIADSGLTQIVNSPTRENNILDIFLTNRPSLINDCHTLSGISDHEIVYKFLHIS